MTIHEIEAPSLPHDPWPKARPADFRHRGLDRIGRTPMLGVRVRIGTQWREIDLKLEKLNPGGSIKDRTAFALVTDLEDRTVIEAGDTVVESTSGNLGAAMAMICAERGYRFHAVVDPLASPENLAAIEQWGGVVDIVQEPDEHGSYLLTRQARVREIASAPGRHWPNQYDNPANARIHREQTAAEIDRQTHGHLDAVFVAVSTGGTFAGIQQYFDAVSPSTRVFAVDVEGSVAIAGRPHPRQLIGIGSARRSSFLRFAPRDFAFVRDLDAIAACHQLRYGTGVGIGGSSGAVLHAACSYLARDHGRGRVVCLCPDGSEKYESTLYDHEWLQSRELDLTVARPAFDDVMGA